MTRRRATIYWLSSIGPVLLGIACDRGTGSDRRFVKKQYVNTDIVFNSNRDQGRVDIYVVDRNGGSLRQLTKNSGNNWGPQWNWRDKTKIIFASDRDGDALELYLMDADGKNSHQITKGISDKGVDHPRWLPVKK